jgi:hypothetical protein
MVGKRRRTIKGAAGGSRSEKRGRPPKNLTVKVSKETVDSTDAIEKIAMEEENESDADQSFASSKKDSDSSVSNEEDIPVAATRSSKKKSSGGETTDSYQEHSVSTINRDSNTVGSTAVPDVTVRSYSRTDLYHYCITGAELLRGVLANERL